MNYAEYHAIDWAIGETDQAIRDEIERCESMWHSKLPHPFPGNAHLTYQRIIALKAILDERRTKRLVSQHDMDTLKDGQKGRESQERSKITSSQAQLAESFRVNQEEKRK